MEEVNTYGFPRKTGTVGEMVFIPAGEWTGGGLCSNSMDLVRWAKALYEGTAMKQPYLKDLFRVGYINDSGSFGGYQYGLGVLIGEDQFGRNYGHVGSYPGYQTGVRYLPEHEIAVAYQVNRDYKNDLIGYMDKLIAALLDD
jgi:D-alanyl-D-alanine carboxypeptidase